ncbi:hypothetical protein EDB84DRAFT_1673977 [Lactarius hengduanensis]|nr:hypothetical protein EDB84DRAFT_1673977 [Lactarius hengduanensis]
MNPLYGCTHQKKNQHSGKKKKKRPVAGQTWAGECLDSNWRAERVYTVPFAVYHSWANPSVELALGTAALPSAGTRPYTSSLLPSGSVASVAIGRGAPETFLRSRSVRSESAFARQTAEVVRAAPNYDPAELVAEDEGAGGFWALGTVTWMAKEGPRRRALEQVWRLRDWRQSAWDASERRSTSQRSTAIGRRRSDAIGDSLPGISGGVVGGVHVASARDTRAITLSKRRGKGIEDVDGRIRPLGQPLIDLIDTLRLFKLLYLNLNLKDGQNSGRRVVAVQLGSKWMRGKVDLVCFLDTLAFEYFECQ